MFPVKEKRVKLKEYPWEASSIQQMSKPNKKVGLIFAGGTVCMAHDPKTNALRPAHTVDLITKACPGLQHIATIETFVVTDIDSTNISPDDWLAMGEIVRDNIDDFDGFVITHGTDTMAYTASGLSFILQDLPKPVIITGSQLPLTDAPGSYARNNLIHAVMYACMDLAEVCICFSAKLMRGNRCRKFSTFEFDAFTSSNYPELGKVGVKPRLSGRQVDRHQRKLRYFDQLERAVGVLTYFPTMPASMITSVVDFGFRGLVIEGAGPGNLPNTDNFAEVIAALYVKGIPIVMTSQCGNGGVDLTLYEVGQQLLDAGAISGGDMTTEAAYAKLMWVLAQTKDIAKIAALMEQDIAGERSE